MIVGLLKVRRKGAPAMAGADRMTIEEVVKQVLLDEHADVIREAAKAVAAEDDGARGGRADRRRAR
jgi:hypothetical protein